MYRYILLISVYRDTCNFSRMLGKRTNLFCRRPFTYTCFFPIYSAYFMQNAYLMSSLLQIHVQRAVSTDATSFDISRGQFIPNSSRIFCPEGKHIFIRYQSSVSLFHPLRFAHVDGSGRKEERERWSYPINPLQ